MELHWRLIYPDRVLDDSPELEAIGLAPRNALRFEVTKDIGGVRRPVIGGLELEKGQRPIFYRHKRGQLGAGTETTATVFGTAYDAGNEIRGQLWAIMGAGPIPCPPALIVQDVVERQFVG